jgi:hypothetical protein
LAETAIGRPLSVAPPSRTAVNMSFRTGSQTTPGTASSKRYGMLRLAAVAQAPSGLSAKPRWQSLAE